MSTLDWAALAPAPEIHECDCRHCDMSGDYDPTEWPHLIVARDGDTVYITDRFLLIDAAHAPIPEDYEGAVTDQGTNAGPLVESMAGATGEPATGLHFRWSTIKAVTSMGWQLRRIYDSESRVAVFADGEPIGVAAVSKSLRNDVWDRDFTLPYEEADQ